MINNNFNEKEYAINLVHKSIREIANDWQVYSDDVMKMTDDEKVEIQRIIDKYIEVIFNLVTPVQIDI